MRKHILALLLAIMSLSPLSAEVFHLNAVVDSIAWGSALTVNATDLICKTYAPKTATYPTTVLSSDSVNAFDRLFMKPYNKKLGQAGTILEVASLGTAAMLAATDKSEWGTIAMMYAESVLLSNGLKELSKDTISRARPYMYFSGSPAEDDWNASFFSGHTTLAFTGAAFTSYVFSKYFPDSKWKIPVIAGCYTLATATAASRIMSGSHFLSDVLTGAIVGTLSGILVPYLHTLEFGEKQKQDGMPKHFFLTASLIPNGFLVCCDF